MSHPRRPVQVSLGLLAAIVALGGAACESSGVNRHKIQIDDDRAVMISQARRRALDAQKVDDPIEAIRLYQEAVSLYPQFGVAWNNLGVLLLESDRFLEAGEAFMSAAEHSRGDPRPLFNLGLTWDRAGYPEDALRFYSQAIDRDPTYLPALRGAVRAERTMSQGDDRTLDLIKAALLQERDDRWRTYFLAQKGEVEKIVYNRQDMSRAAPAPNPAPARIDPATPNSP